MIAYRIKLVLVTAVLILAIAQPCHGQYTTDWVANTYGTNATRVGNVARSMWIAPEGVIYTSSDWDENEGGVAIYQNGQSIGSIGAHGEFQGGAITGNATSIFSALQFSTTYGSGKVGRYGRTSHTRDLLIAVSATTTERKADVVTGLATAGSLLYASDYPGNRVRVFTTNGVWQSDISVTGPGALAVDGLGNIWVAQKNAGTVREFNPSGALLNTISIATAARPSALYFDATANQLMVGDEGPDMNIKIYNIAGTPFLADTFGVQGGYLDSTQGIKGQVGSKRFTRVVGIGKDSSGNLYVLNNPWGGTWDLGRDGGTDIHSYDSSGNLQWTLQSLNFEAVAAADSGTDGDYLYSGNIIYKGSSGAGYVANTLDPITYPSDPRINLNDPSRGEHFGQLATVGSNRILVAAGQNPDIFYFFYFNPASGYIAIPMGSIPGTPFNTTARIRDGFCLDSKGDVWAGLDKTNAIWHYPLTGFDSNGKPTWGAGISTPTPNPTWPITRILYLPESDTMILARGIVGSTDWTAIGSTVEVYRGWMAGNTTTPTKVINITSANPKTIAAAGNYLFVGYVHTVPNIDAFNLTTGTVDVTFTNSSPNTVYVGNDVDSMYGIRAYLKSTGEYLVTKDDYNGSSIVIYRWTPGGVKTALTITPQPATATYGSSTTALSATADFTGSTSPTGAMVFQVGSGNQMPGSCSSNSNVFSCTANYPTSGLASGSYTINVSYAGDSAFAPGFASSSLAITQAAPTVVATANTCSYNAVGCSGSGSAAGVNGEALTPVTLSYSGTNGVSYGPAATAPVLVGIYAVTANFAGNANYTPGTSTPAPIVITPAATMLSSFTVSPNPPQYSDPVNITVTPVSVPAIGGSVSFYLNYGTAAQVQLGATQTVAAGGAASVSSVLLESVVGSLVPADHTVTAIFAPTDPVNFNGSSNNFPLMIAREDANLTYTGQYVLDTSSPSTYSVTAPLTFTVQDSNAVPNTSVIYDANPGDIRNARYKILVDGVATTGCSGLQPSLITADTRVGTIGCNYTFSFSSNQTGIAPTITLAPDTASYYAASTGDNSFAMSVNLPSQTNFITGGGFLVNSTSAGAYAGDAGTKTHFAFNAKYANGGTTLQGNSNIIVSSKGRLYQIQTTSITSFGMTDTAQGGYGSILATATIQDVTDPLNPILIEGNDALTISFYDNGTPGTNDTIAISVYKDGMLRFASAWDGTATVEQNLDGGNLAAH